MTRSYGSKAQQTDGLHGAQLNKVMAKDVNGKLPKGLRVTLRMHGGKGLTATIHGCEQIHNPERLRLEARAAAGDKAAQKEVADHYWFDKHHPRHAPEAELLLAFVERTIGAYNFDGSDSMADYFDVRFYLTVEFNREESEAQRAAIVAAGSPLRAQRVELLHTAWAVCSDWRAENGKKPLSAFDATEVRFMRRALIEALGAEFVAHLEAQVAEVDAKLAACDDWQPQGGAQVAA